MATVLLQFYARRLAGAPLWWDDWFALATVVGRFQILKHARLIPDFPN